MSWLGLPRSWSFIGSQVSTVRVFATLDWVYLRWLPGEACSWLLSTYRSTLEQSVTVPHRVSEPGCLYIAGLEFMEEFDCYCSLELAVKTMALFHLAIWRFCLPFVAELRLLCWHLTIISLCLDSVLAVFLGEVGLLLTLGESVGFPAGHRALRSLWLSLAYCFLWHLP